MAQHAFARPCAFCQTLVTFSGALDDEQFGALCPSCGQTNTQPNPNDYVGTKPAVVEPVVDEVAEPVDDPAKSDQPVVSEVAPSPIAPTEAALRDEA